MLPFSRVAIFHAPLIFGPELPESFEKEEARRFSHWVDGAASCGADAWYARVQGLPTRIALDVLNYYRRNLSQDIPHVILPAAYRNATFRDYTALHCREGEEKPAPGRGHAPALVGKSCHSRQGVMSAEEQGFDYAFLSPVFPTPTHPEAPALGLAELQNSCTEVSIPVIALGGITGPESEEACRSAGAWGVAGIRRFTPEPFTPENLATK